MARPSTSGTLASERWDLASVASSARRAVSSGCVPASAASVGSNAASAATRSYAAVVIQNPSGTGNPALASSPRFAALPPATASALLSIALKGSISLDPPLSAPFICFSFLLHFAERAGGEQEKHYAVAGEHGEAALHVLERPARLDELLDHVIGPEQREHVPQPVGPGRQFVHVDEQPGEKDGREYDQGHEGEDLALVAGERGDEDAQHHGRNGQKPHDHEQHHERLPVVVELEEPDRLGQSGDGLEGREPQKTEHVPAYYLRAPKAVYEHPLHGPHRPLLHERDGAEQEGQKMDQEGGNGHGVARHVEGGGRVSKKILRKYTTMSGAATESTRNLGFLKSCLTTLPATSNARRITLPPLSRSATERPSPANPSARR